MSKYRIVKRALYGRLVYMPQTTFLWIWYDCYEDGCATIEEAQELIARWTANERVDGEVVWP